MIKELYISELVKPLANQSVMLNEEFGDCAIFPDFDPANKFTINLFLSMQMQNCLLMPTVLSLVFDEKFFRKLTECPTRDIEH
jgi:hypothetical protein